MTLTGTTYSASSTLSHFTLATAVPGLTVYSVGFNDGRTVATLRLHYDGSDFDAAATLAVTVNAAGTEHSAALTTGTRAVDPARWVNVSKKTVALTEGGGAATYTVALESPPTGNVTVTVASDNAAVSRSPGTLAFTTTNWATAQTVTVTPVDDNADAHDELALVTNEATGGGYATSTLASRTVRVTVADDEQTGTDYDADDDGLIENQRPRPVERHALGPRRQRLVPERRLRYRLPQPRHRHGLPRWRRLEPDAGRLQGLRADGEHRPRHRRRRQRGLPRRLLEQRPWLGSDRRTTQEVGHAFHGDVPRQRLQGVEHVPAP